jgi:large subunit ribosomal protein L4
MKLNAVTTTGTKSTVTVSDSVFGGEVKDQLIGQALRVYISNGHQGTSRVKTRAEVSRTKKKWFKQKGTGNARHAARSAPIFVGGGVAHGPKGIKPGNLQLSQKQKRAALKAALSLQNTKIIVSEGIEQLGAKTAVASKTLKTISADPGLILMIISKWNADLEQGMRNIPYIKVTTAEHMTVLDVCSADTIIMSPESVDAVTARVESTSKKSSKAAKAMAAEKTEVSFPEKIVTKPAVKKAAKAAKPKASSIKKNVADSKKITSKKIAKK